MNSIIIKVVIGLIIASGGYYAFTEVNTKKAMPTEETTVVAEKSMAEKLLSGGNWKCNSQIKSDTVATEIMSNNVSYVSDKKIRTDVDMKVGGQTVKSSMLIIDDTMYVWTSAAPFGTKMKYDKDAFVKSMNDNGASTQMTGTYNKDNIRVSYNCEAWAPDMSIFVLPANISFKEISQQYNIKNSINTGNTGVTIESNIGGSDEIKTNSLQVGGVNLKSTKPVNNATINIEGGEVKVQGSYGGYSF